LVITNNYISDKEIDLINTNTTNAYGGFNFYKYTDDTTITQIMKVDGMGDLFISGSFNSSTDINTTNDITCSNLNTKKISLTNSTSTPTGGQLGYLIDSSNSSKSLVTTNLIHNAITISVGIGSWIINYTMFIITTSEYSNLNGFYIGFSFSDTESIDLKGSYRNVSTVSMSAGDGFSITGNYMISQIEASTLYINYNANPKSTTTGSYTYKLYYQLMRVG
jgi:hypothetical protein